MTNIGIDWVSAGIFLVTYAVAQIRAVPLRPRFVVLAVGCGAIAAYRTQHFGTQGINFVITLVAAGLGVYYLVKAFMAKEPGSRGA